MKVYVSVDMEGVAGITSLNQTVVGQLGFPSAQALVTAEAAAAVRGAFEAGATDVVVSDGHGTMENLMFQQVDPRARLVSGRPRALCMAHGLDPSFDVALFVGYHASAGRPGVLAHTFSAEISALRVDGQMVSEAEVNAWYAGSLAVPVGLVTGDDQICELARQVLPGVVVAEVKRAAGWSAADSLHPVAAAELIRTRAAEAVIASRGLEPLAPPTELVVELDTQLPEGAELLAMMPGAERVADLTVRHRMRHIEDLLGAIAVWSELLTAARRRRSALVARL